MFCSTAGRGPIRYIRLSPKYFHTNDPGAQGQGSSRTSEVLSANSVMRNIVTNFALCNNVTADTGDKRAITESYLSGRPVMARAITSRWISLVPSKMVKILASRCIRSTG